MARSIEFGVNEFYHLYNRGTDRRTVFLDTKDHERFMLLLYLANSVTPFHISNYQGSTSLELFSIKKEDTLVDIGAYCLMPNHFHVLAHEKKENGISTFMQKLTTGYTMYFNKKYDRTGALFGGRYKAIHADRDEYLRYLFAYIHLNPVKIVDAAWKEGGIHDKTRAEEHLSSYQYSSYLDHCKSNRIENVILNTEAFPDYFQSPVSFKDFVSLWLESSEVQPR